MTKGWTEERRQKARERILKNKPWEKSTGPKTPKGKKKSSLNALKHGHRSDIYLSYVRHILELNTLTIEQLDAFESFNMLNSLFAKELIKKAMKSKGKKIEN